MNEKDVKIRRGNNTLLHKQKNFNLMTVKPERDDFIILKHHGVMGMRWGKRKGPASAPKRPGLIGKVKASHSTKKANKAYAKEWQNAYSNRRTLTYAELREKVNRLQLESNFGRLVAETKISDRKRAKAAIKEYAEVSGNAKKAVTNSKFLYKAVKTATTAAL